MPAYVVVDIEVEDVARYTDYRGQAPASIAAHGGRYLARGGRTEVFEGTWKPSRLVILEFPTLEQARTWLESPEYAEARALRHATARTNMVAIEGI
ncbi:MAG: DUF1330 domain-containing protein [Candidatus Eisenbacteria bacterium]